MDDGDFVTGVLLHPAGSQARWRVDRTPVNKITIIHVCWLNLGCMPVTKFISIEEM